MYKREIALIGAALMVLGGLGAEVNKWTGEAGDGLYFTDGNWSLGKTPGNSPTDDILISGEDVVVSYRPGGDFSPKGTVTISNGAKFVQEEGIAWTQLTAARVIIESGATYDLGTSQQLQLGEGQLEIREGGTLLLPNATFVAANGQITINGGRLEAKSFELGSAHLIFQKTGSLICQSSFTRNNGASIQIDEGATPTLVPGVGAFKLLDTDNFWAGNISVSGELQPVPGASFDGANWTAKILAPQTNGTVIPAKAGHITVLETGNDGFWAPGGSYIDIVEGSTASFTFPLSKSAVYEKLIKSKKFRYKGNEVTQAEFEDTRRWTVVEEGEGADVKTTFSLSNSSVILPVWGSVSAEVAEGDESSAMLSGVLDKMGTLEIKAVRLRYRLAEAEADQVMELDIPTDLADGATFSVQLTGLEEKKEYVYQFQLIDTDDEEFVSAEGTFVTYRVPAGVVAWIGQTSSLASEPSNWSTGSVPTAQDDIEVTDVMAKNVKLVWDLPSATLGGWIQRSFTGGVVTVSFQTTPTDGVTFTGDVVLENGANWTHDGPPKSGEAPQYALNLVFEKNLTVAEGAYIQAGRGMTNDERYRGRGWYNGGPGYFDIGGENPENRKALGRGASFAGEGGYRTETFPEGLDFVTYGSALNPSGWGSSGHGDGTSFAGGGWIRLAVSGTLTLDGAIVSTGFGYPNANGGTSVGASSGGVIDIEAASLEGQGQISADGGCDQEGGNGSGGRIRVKLTDANAELDGWSDRIHAMGGYQRNEATPPQVAGVKDAAAGTVFLQTASDGEGGKGLLRIVGLTGRTNEAGATALLADDCTDSLRHVSLEVGAETPVKLTKDCTVRRLVVAGTRVRNGVYTAEALNASLNLEKPLFSGEGTLTIAPAGGLMIIVR